MDPFDEHILSVLRDGRPREFCQLLMEVGFSHNTLRLHLNVLVDQGLVIKEKMPVKRLGRPKIMYSMPPGLRRQASSILSNPFTEVVTLTFKRLRHLCRFEKGGRCKKTRGLCEAQNCPQIIKKA